MRRTPGRGIPAGRREPPAIKTTWTAGACTVSCVSPVTRRCPQRAPLAGSPAWHQPTPVLPTRGAREHVLQSLHGHQARDHGTQALLLRCPAGRSRRGSGLRAQFLRVRLARARRCQPRQRQRQQKPARLLVRPEAWAPPIRPARHVPTPVPPFQRRQGAAHEYAYSGATGPRCTATAPSAALRGHQKPRGSYRAGSGAGPSSGGGSAVHCWDACGPWSGSGTKLAGCVSGWCRWPRVAFRRY